MVYSSNKRSLFEILALAAVVEDYIPDPGPESVRVDWPMWPPGGSHGLSRGLPWITGPKKNEQTTMTATTVRTDRWTIYTVPKIQIRHWEQYLNVPVC